MKKIILLSVIIPAMYIHPQVREIESRTYFKQGDIEANISTNLGVGFSTTNSTNTYKNYNYYDSSYVTETYKSEYSDRPFNFLITASIGVCIFDGLNVEPEVDLNLFGGEEVSISLLGNLTYNFSIPKQNVFPFIKIGYGVSNYFFDYDYNYSSGAGNNSLDTKIINAGAGLKLVYSSGMAMKLEINYKHYSYSNSNSYGDQYYQNSYESDTVMDALTISIGYSILL